MNDFNNLLDIVSQLRKECPWDKEQTHESLAKHLIEESYELLDTLSNLNDSPESFNDFKEELGDLLLQILLHSEIASENNYFSIIEVINSLQKKLIKRHPHVFDKKNLNSSEEVEKQWEEIKKEGNKSIFDDINTKLPPVNTAFKVQRKAKTLNLSYKNYDEALDDLISEINELKEATTLEDRKSELGDVYFSLINVSRYLEADPEIELKKSIQTFINRAKYVEKHINKETDINVLWQEAKKNQNVKTIISDTLIGVDVTDQSNIDNKLIELDGTDNKNNLGANAILAVSMASMRASANQQNKQLFELFPNIYGPPSLPVPFMNILNGGAHADNSVDIQEFMIVPFGFETFDTSLRAGVEIYHVLKKRLKSNKLSTNVGDEGGFAPNFNTSTEILDEIMQSISEAGYEPGRNVSLALDVAASEFFKDDFYRIEGNELNSQEMSDYLINLTSNYPIISIEDGLAEDDWDGWKYLTEKIGDTIQLVGDDLFVTQEKILEKGVADSCANSILVKVNQVGSVSETINTMTLAKDSNYSSIVSHRSGETEDTFISHLCVGTSSGQIKTGAPARSERTAKYNELLRIGEKIGFEQFNIQELGYSK